MTVERAVEIIRDNTEGDCGTGCTVVHGIWRAGKALADAGLLRTEADDVNQAIADRVRELRGRLFGDVFVDGSDVMRDDEIVDYLLNGGES